ncbi:hypothetical protein ScPMuIL_008777 [Solemya velum]
MCEACVGSVTPTYTSKEFGRRFRYFRRILMLTMDILNDCCSMTVAGVLVVCAIAGYFFLNRKWTIPRDYSKWVTKDYPKDVVLLHHIGRSAYVPCLSPFPLKLETYFRIAKIPYKTVASLNFGPKNKIPWMEYNGEVVTDSEFCIKFLNDKLGVDLNKHLTSEQKATARILQRMIDEHFYWPYVYHRWVFDKEQKTLLRNKVPKMVIWMFRRKIESASNGQGIGRHSQEEIEHIARTDLQALSDFLGTKKYMMGEKISEVDCAVFGQLVQTVASLNFGPKNKIPWMEYNGEVVTDSEFCIKFLNDKLGVDLNKHLTSEQKATARILQRMIDEHFYWPYVYHRWVFDKEQKTLLRNKVPKMVIWMFRRKIESASNGQGIGRHSQEEIEHIARTDLQALSDFLGTKKYMMGEKISEVDCAVFGQLVQVRWETDDCPAGIIIKEHQNLLEYLDRIKEKVWPDWEECTTKGGTVEATA